MHSSNGMWNGKLFLMPCAHCVRFRRKDDLDQYRAIWRFDRHRLREHNDRLRVYREVLIEGSTSGKEPGQSELG